MRKTIVFAITLIFMSCYDWSTSEDSDAPAVFTTSKWTPQVIQNPQAYFNSNNSAKMVFHSGNLLCGIDSLVNVRCWSLNWLDSSVKWNASILDSFIVLWDSSNVRVLSIQNFNQVFQAKGIIDQRVDVLNTIMSSALRGILIQSIVMPDSLTLMIGSESGLFKIHQNDSIKKFHDGAVLSRFWKEGNGYCAFGAGDSIVCVQGDSVTVTGSNDFGLTARWGPYYWNGTYWRLLIYPTKYLSASSVIHMSYIYESSVESGGQNIGTSQINSEHYSTVTSNDDYLALVGFSDFGKQVEVLIYSSSDSIQNSFMDKFSGQSLITRSANAWFLNDQIIIAVSDLDIWDQSSSVSIYAYRLKDGVDFRALAA